MRDLARVHIAWLALLCIATILVHLEFQPKFLDSCKGFRPPTVVSKDQSQFEVGTRGGAEMNVICPLTFEWPSQGTPSI